MKEVILKYDEDTGTIYDVDGTALITWYELKYKEVPEAVVDPLDKITKLKSMMSVDDMLALKEVGLL